MCFTYLSFFYLLTQSIKKLYAIGKALEYNNKFLCHTTYMYCLLKLCSSPWDGIVFMFILKVTKSGFGESTSWCFAATKWEGHSFHTEMTTSPNYVHTLSLCYALLRVRRQNKTDQIFVFIISLWPSECTRPLTRALRSVKEWMSELVDGYCFLSHDRHSLKNVHT